MSDVIRHEYTSQYTSQWELAVAEEASIQSLLSTRLVETGLGVELSPKMGGRMRAEVIGASSLLRARNCSKCGSRHSPRDGHARGTCKERGALQGLTHVLQQQGWTHGWAPPTPRTTVRTICKRPGCAHCLSPGIGSRSVEPSAAQNKPAAFLS